MKFRFSKCALTLSLALLASTNNALVSAEETSTDTPVLKTETEISSSVATSQAEATTGEVATPTTTETTAGEAVTPTTETTDQSVTPVTEEAAPVVETSNTPVNDTTASPVTATRAAATETTTPVEGQSVDVRILATTDLHTNLVNYDYYQDKPVETLGLAKTAVLIEEAKKENPNVVLVDNGDTIQGTPLGNYKSIVDPIEEGEQHPMYAALETLGFDVGTLGNHEFNYGLAYLEKVIRTANMPLVNANVLDPTTKDFLYTPYLIPL